MLNVVLTFAWLVTLVIAYRIGRTDERVDAMERDTIRRLDAIIDKTAPPRAGRGGRT